MLSSVSPRREVVTIGYEGRTIDDVLARLVDLGVTLVADVRMTPTSRAPGFSKNRLRARLAERGIAYEHLPGLGNPKANRRPFRSGSPASRRAYLDAVEASGLEDLRRLEALVRDERVALLCFERRHAECHRSSVAGLLVLGDPTITVVAAES